MNLSRLINEIEVLYRNEAQFGSVRHTVEQLVIDYIYGTFGYDEPPMPVYPDYVWPEGVTTFE